MAAVDTTTPLRDQKKKTLLRIILCGSVDDGKSTLLGRLLYDCQALFEDQLATLESDSRQFGTTGTGNLDLALLVDGLAAEREQGITIDVAYRYLTTARRGFIIADTPGHEQYTRNMVTGASTSDLAVLLVDARKGVLTQTRRHSHIVSRLGIQHVVLAINKMDLVGWNRKTFERIATDYRAFARQLGIKNITCIPVSALTGDNIYHASKTMGWYKGRTLLGHLEMVNIGNGKSSQPFRMPVQWVNRPNQDFRGYSGTIAGGMVSVGDPVTVLPSGKNTTISRIVTLDGDMRKATSGQAVTLLLTDDIDVARGDIIAAAQALPELADQFAAHIVWMDERPLLPGRSYILQLGTVSVNAQITAIKHKINVDTLEHIAAKHLNINEIAVCNVSLDRIVPFESYADNRTMGSFILIDRISNATIGCGMIDFLLY